MCLGTNVCGHKCVWAQSCVDTNVCGHKRVWAQSCLGTIVCGHNRVWAQSCLGTDVSGPNRVGSIMYGTENHQNNSYDCSEYESVDEKNYLRLCPEKNDEKIIQAVKGCTIKNSACRYEYGFLHAM